MTIHGLQRCCHFPAASNQACQTAVRCCEWSSLSCLLVLFKNSKNKKAIRNHHILMMGRKLLLFSFKSWLAEYLPTLCMFKQRRQMPTREGNTAMPLPHWASSVFCYNWMKGRFSSCATSDLQSNSNERGKGKEEDKKEYKPAPPQSLSKLSPLPEPYLWAPTFPPVSPSTVLWKKGH